MALRSERAALCGTTTSVAETADCCIATWLTDGCSLTSDRAEGMRSSCGLPKGTCIVRIRGVSAGGVIVPALMLMARDRGVDGTDSDGAPELPESVYSSTADGIVVTALGGGSWVVAPASLCVILLNESCVHHMHMYNSVPDIVEVLFRGGVRGFERVFGPR